MSDPGPICCEHTSSARHTAIATWAHNDGRAFELINRIREYRRHPGRRKCVDCARRACGAFVRNQKLSSIWGQLICRVSKDQLAPYAGQFLVPNEGSAG